MSSKIRYEKITFNNIDIFFVSQIEVFGILYGRYKIK